MKRRLPASRLILPGLTIVLACAQTNWCAFQLQADTKSLREQRKAAEANAKQAQAMADHSRFSLIQLALALRAQETASARGQVAPLSLEEQRMQVRIETRQWALGQFEAGQRKVATGTRYSSIYLDGLQRAQELARKRQVEFPEHERLAIRSGTALNSLFQACGDVAVQSASMRALLKDRLRSDISTDDRRRDLTELYRALEWIRGPDSLTEYHRQRLRFSSGIGTSAIIIESRHAKDAALPLRWPAAILADSDFLPHMETLKQAKQRALSDLEAGRPIDYQLTAQPMLEAADRIRELVAHRIWQLAQGPTDARRFNDLNEARSFSLALRDGVTRFIQASELSDVQPSEPLSANTIEDLLAFMRRQGYQFAPADVRAEATHREMYLQLVAYYQRWQGLRLAQDSDERELADVQRRLTRVFEIGYGSNSMKELEAVLQARPKRDLLDVVRELSEIATNITTVLNNP